MVGRGVRWVERGGMGGRGVEGWDGVEGAYWIHSVQ